MNKTITLITTLFLLSTIVNAQTLSDIDKEITNIDTLFKQNNYTPSGCVTASFSTNNKGEPTNIKILKTFPKQAFSHQAYETIKKQNHQPNITTTTYLEFKGNNKHPLPYDCLAISGKLININNQPLETEELSLIKEAIDARVFHTILNNINVTTSPPTIKKNENGTFKLETTIYWETDTTQTKDLLQHYLLITQGTNKERTVNTIGLKRGLYTKNEEKLKTEIFNYIGQRKIEITTTINGEPTNTLIGTPLHGNQFCNGTTATNVSFEQYCITWLNNKGHTITKDNLSQEDIKQIKIETTINIRNTFLL